MENASSGLDDVMERKDFIQANHVDMCRYSGPEDDGYRKVRDALKRHLGVLGNKDSATKAGQS